MGPSELVMASVMEDGRPLGLGVRFVRRSERELKWSTRLEEAAALETAFLLTISIGMTVVFETCRGCKIDELEGDGELPRSKTHNSSVA